MRRPVFVSIHRPAIRQRRGLTLVELLVVVGVMVILMGIALPLMKTGLEGRQVREAARQLSTYVELAKSQAAETARPAGLWFDTQMLPESTNPSDPLYPFVCVGQLFLAETPPPYSGDVVDARATISYDAGNNVWQAVFAADSNNLLLLANIGDSIRFDYKGPVYLITWVSWPTPCPQPPPPPPYTIRFSGSPEPPAGAGSLYLPYQVFRRPQKSSSMPMEFPNSIVVDLKHSGFGAGSQNFWSTTQPIVILFGPSGTVEQVIAGSTTVVPTDTIHFLIGRVEQVGHEGPSSSATWGRCNENLQDPNNLWVSIGHQSGRATAAENAPLAMDWRANTYYEVGDYCRPVGSNVGWYKATVAGISGQSEPSWPGLNNTVTDNAVTWKGVPLLEVAREFAQSAQSMGGR